MAGEFFSYVGDPDFHDGEIVAVACEGSTARIHLRGQSGRLFEIVFNGVQTVDQSHSVGMKVYALAEMRGSGPARRFVFANWDENDDAALEIRSIGVDWRRLPA